MRKKLPLVALTMGDPAGIGPETALKAVFDKSVSSFARVMVIGTEEIFSALPVRKSGLAFKTRAISRVEDAQFEEGVADVFHLPFEKTSGIKWGQLSALTGEMSAQYVKKSVELALQKKVDAVVHSPISKTAWKMAGVPFPAHTELIASMCKSKNFAMAIAAGPLRTVMATRHVPLASAAQNLKKQEVVEAILMADLWMRQLKIKKPRIGVCALNPHAGEGGLIGREELRVVRPAIALAQKKVRAKLSDAIPADSAMRDHRNGLWDCLVTLYHDQSLIPLKIMYPEQLVNITLGLPFPRVSPGHGTAFDIAGKNKAGAQATIEAIRVAASMV